MSFGLDSDCFEDEEAGVFFDAIQKLYSDGRSISGAGIIEVLRKLKVKKKRAEELFGMVSACEDGVSQEEYDNIISGVIENRIHAIDSDACKVYTELPEDFTKDDIISAHRKNAEILEQKNKYTVQTDNIDSIIDDCKEDAENLIAGIKRERHLPMDWVNDFENDFYDIEDDEYIVIGATQGGGKSSFAINIENGLLDAGKSYFKGSFEMSIKELTSVIAGQRSRTNPRKIHQEHSSKQQAYYEELERLRQFYRDGKFGYTHDEQIDGFLRDYERFKMEKGKPSCVIVDYLQQMKCSSDSVKLGRNYQLAEISRKLKKITIQDNIPVIALVQLNKNHKAENRPPRKDDIKDCNDIVSDANRIWLLHMPEKCRDGYEQKKNWKKDITWIQDKCRGGPWFERWINFNGPQRRFLG